MGSKSEYPTIGPFRLSGGVIFGNENIICLFKGIFKRILINSDFYRTAINNYTNGFEGEVGANWVLFDFLSLSMGADVLFGHRVAFDINCTIGFAVDLTQ